jgi:hypothetical protein
VSALNQFAKPTPELAGNLSLVLHDLDTQSKAVEADPRSPGGKGYSGLEALLQYVFEQTNAIDYFGQFGHILAVDGFVNECAPYQTPATVSAGLKAYGSSFRQCYSWLGPNQPGVNERDPTDTTATIPDPGGSPPGEPGPTGSITTSADTSAKAETHTGVSKAPATSEPQKTASTTSTVPSSAPSQSGTGTGTTTTAPPTSGSPPAINLGAIGQLLNGVLGGGSSSSGSGSGSSSSGGLGGLLSGVLGNARSASAKASTTKASASDSGATPSDSGQTTSQQAQQLLNYLLSP